MFTTKIRPARTRLFLAFATLFSAPISAQTSEITSPEEVVVFGRVQAEENLQVPQTVDVIDEQLLENLGASSVGDALRFIPGASRDGSSLDAFGDTYLMHGFYSSQTVNGIGVNRLNSARDSVNIERIEVLKGPASVLYGQLQPGAVINLVTKQPQREKNVSMSLEGAQHNQYRATADATGALTADENLRGRITAAYENKDSFVDFWHKDHHFVSIALAYDLSERTTLTWTPSIPKPIGTASTTA